MTDKIRVSQPENLSKALVLKMIKISEQNFTKVVKKPSKKPKRKNPLNLFYLKVSKRGLKRLIQSLKTNNRKTRPRAMQAILFVLAWSQNGQRALGTTYKYGRSKGKLCYSKALKLGLCRFMGIEHKQAVRYLNNLKKVHWIHSTNQFTLDGTLEYRISPVQYLIPGVKEKYFFFNLRGTGKKGFDIFEALETALAEDSHPEERDTDQLKFDIPERTQRWRRSRHDALTQKKSKKIDTLGQDSNFSDRQEMTPIVKRNPLPFSRKGSNTSLPRGKFNKRLVFLKMPHRERYEVPWYELKRLSEFQKVQAGVDVTDRAVWHCGKVFLWNPRFGDYKFVPKSKKSKTAKNDPSFHKYAKSYEINRVTPTSLGVFSNEDLEKNNTERFNSPVDPKIQAKFQKYAQSAKAKISRQKPSL